MAVVCKRNLYSGRVQGVGFRYTARSIASAFPVTGFVRNLSNGQVEIVVEGESDAVTEFLAAVADRMRSYITDTDLTDATSAGCLDFGIR